MATLIYADKENGSVPTPVPSKRRNRLQSVPDGYVTPFSKKTQLAAPLQSGRKALGTVNKISSTPLVSFSKQEKSKSLQVNIKANPQPSEYPEIEKFIPYNPLDFECFEVPEEVRLSHLCLAGLGSLPLAAPQDDFEVPDTHLQLSPLKAQCDFSADLDSFLQSVSELTVDMPPELNY